MTEVVSRLDKEENLITSGQEKESKPKVVQISIFKCVNRTCELEFLIFEDNSHSIVYCPKCKGVIVKNAGTLKVAILNSDAKLLE
jgi:hypothetical protein